MKTMQLKRVRAGLKGHLNIPGDKSISHRSIMLGAIAKGRTTVKNFLPGDDCLHTVKIFQHLGVHIEQNGTDVTIYSDGFTSFKEPLVPLYFGNSGTTARLMFGILTALPFHTVIHGDPHLTVRPMDRVVHPLRKMGAKINGRSDGSFLPIAIKGSTLSSIHYEMPVKSAQVKSAILLAGLFAEGSTSVVEVTKTRDHTENMLQAFGAHINVNGNEVTISNKHELTGTDVTVPGDISSAAFFLVAGAIVPNSSLTLKNVGLNKTRTGIIDVMKQMSAHIDIDNVNESGGELAGDITIHHAPLKGTIIDGDLIPRLIDEIPIIALLATQAEGKTVIKDAAELRVKETDRIKAVVNNLSQLGAKIEETEDGMIIHGQTPLSGGNVRGYSDHRIAMMAVIASLICEDNVVLDDASSIAVSYPNFFEHLNKIS